MVLLLLLLDWMNLLVLLLLHLLLLQVHLLLTLLLNLIHEGSLIHTFRCVETWCAFAVPLNLMLVTHWD